MAGRIVSETPVSGKWLKCWSYALNNIPPSPAISCWSAELVWQHAQLCRPSKETGQRRQQTTEGNQGRHIDPLRFLLSPLSLFSYGRDSVQAPFAFLLGHISCLVGPPLFSVGPLFVYRSAPLRFSIGFSTNP